MNLDTDDEILDYAKRERYARVVTGAIIDEAIDRAVKPFTAGDLAEHLWMDVWLGDGARPSEYLIALYLDVRVKAKRLRRAGERPCRYEVP